MKIDKSSLERIAHLARLEFDTQKSDEMIKSLTEILDWVEKLNELDTDNVEPLTNMSHELNVLREDKVGEHLDHQRALKNAPDKDSDYIHVPKVLE